MGISPREILSKRFGSIPLREVRNLVMVPQTATIFFLVIYDLRHGPMLLRGLGEVISELTQCE